MERERDGWGWRRIEKMVRVCRMYLRQLRREDCLLRILVYDYTYA